MSRADSQACLTYTPLQTDGPLASLRPTSLTTCKPSLASLHESPGHSFPQPGRTGNRAQIIAHPGSDLMTLRNLIAQRISFPFTSGNWRVRIFFEHSLFIFPRFKSSDIGNGVKFVICSFRGQNKHYVEAEFSLNKEKLTPKVVCPPGSEHPAIGSIQLKLFAKIFKC